MFIARASNSKTGLNYSSIFDTEELADAWVSDRVSDGSWGNQEDYTYSVEEVDLSGNSQEAIDKRREESMEKIETWRKFTDFGKDVSLYFTALINERNFNQTQKDMVQSDIDIQRVMQELNFGRIAKAKSMITSKTADEIVFFQEDLDAVAQLMDDFLLDYI